MFLPGSKANSVLPRWRRASSYLLEEILQGNLEKECYEEICNYEEAREVFENDAGTVRKLSLSAPACFLTALAQLPRDWLVHFLMVRLAQA